MKKSAILLGSVAIVALLMTTDGFARGGGGGGRGGGGFSGGGARGGGGFSGAATRPAASPSMSRAAPAVQRPAQSAVAPRPAASPATRPATGGPAGGGLNVGSRPGLDSGSRFGTAPAAAGRAALQSPQSFQRPTQSQVSNFLNLPQQPQTGARSSPPSAGQLPSGGQGIQSKTITTPGGSTITVAGGKGSGATGGGATVGGAGAAIKVEGAGGNTYVKGKGAAGVTKDGNTAIAAGSRAGIETAPDRASPGDVVADQGKATLKYFKSVDRFLGDLKNDMRDMKTTGQSAVWFDKYARKIERLPMLGVDPEMLDYGKFVATGLRSGALDTRNVNIQAGAQQYQVAGNTGGAYDPSYYGGYGNGRGGYGGGWYGGPVAGVASARNAARQEIRTEGQDKRVIRTQARADIAGGVHSIKDQIVQATNEVRRKMTERYRLEF